MVRLETNQPANNKAPVPGTTKSSYGYGQNYSSFWDAVLLDEKNNHKPSGSGSGSSDPDRSFDKKDLLELSGDKQRHVKAPPTPTPLPSPAIVTAASYDGSEHKEEEREVRSQIHHHASSATNTHSSRAATSHDAVLRAQALLEAHASLKVQQEQQEQQQQEQQQKVLPEIVPVEEIATAANDDAATTPPLSSSSLVQNPFLSASPQAVDLEVEYSQAVQSLVANVDLYVQGDVDLNGKATEATVEELAKGSLPTVQEPTTVQQPVEGAPMDEQAPMDKAKTGLVEGSTTNPIVVTIEKAPKPLDESVISPGTTPTNGTTTNTNAGSATAITATHERMAQLIAKAVQDAAKKELEARLVQQGQQSQSQKAPAPPPSSPPPQQQQQPQKQSHTYYHSHSHSNHRAVMEEKKSESPPPPQSSSNATLDKAHHIYRQAQVKAKTFNVLPSRQQQSSPEQPLYHLEGRNHDMVLHSLSPMTTNSSRSNNSAKSSSASVSPQVNHLLAAADAMDSHIDNTAATTKNINHTTNDIQSTASRLSAYAQKHYATSQPVSDEELQACLDHDGDWLHQAKRQAEAKAKALITAAHAEAAARTRARAELLARRQHQERERLKAETEAKLKAQAVRDAYHFEETRAMIQAEERAKARAKALAKTQAEAKLRAKAQLDAAHAKAAEEARAQAKAQVERKLRQKAASDATFFAELEAAGKAVDQTEAAEAKIRARAAQQEEDFSQTLSATQLKAKAMARGETLGGRSSSSGPGSAAAPPAGTPKEFVPFGKSKGEDDDNCITLFLQVPGVVHVSELKVELEDGVIYISRGIVVSGKAGVQKYTRSFPFEEDLLDTPRFIVTLIPANATADGVSVLRFALPKVKAIAPFQIPVVVVQAEQEEPEKLQAKSAARPIKIHDDMNDMTEVSLDAPDDEVSDHLGADAPSVDGSEAPDDERAADTPSTSFVEEEDEDDDEVDDSSSSIQEADGERIYSMHVPQSVALEDIAAVYDGASISVEAGDDMQHIFPLTSKEARVRQIRGSLDVSSSTLVLRVPLIAQQQQSRHDSQQQPKPKARRLRVYKYVDNVAPSDTSGMLSVFGDDDMSMSSKGSALLPKKKTGLKKGIKSIASKYLKMRPKKPKS